MLIFENQQSLRRRGRPPNSTRKPTISELSLKSANPSTRKRHRSLKNIKSRQKLAKLEALPTELLELIFLHSLNFNFPRASPVIAGKLSSQHIYMKTIMGVLVPTCNSSYKQARKMQSLDSETKSDTRVMGDPLLQVSILC